MARLHAASLVSRIGIPALVPWCLRLCLDGLLYYREASDAARSRAHGAAGHRWHAGLEVFPEEVRTTLLPSV